MRTVTQTGIDRFLAAHSSSEERSLATQLAFELMIEGRESSSLPDFVDLLGPEKALLLVLVFGGSNVRIPSFGRLVVAFNEAAAAIALKNGKSVPDVCSGHSIDKGRVKVILDALKKVEKHRKDVLRKIAEEDDRDLIHEITGA